MKQLLLPALLLGLLYPTAPVFASASGAATIDWDSFSVQLIDLSGGLNTPVFTWTSQYGEVYSYAYTPTSTSYGGYYQASDFSSPLLSVSDTSAAQVTASRDADALHAYAATQPGTNPWGSGYNNYAYGYSYNYGAFSLSGNGVAVITMDWDVSLTGSMGNWNDYSYAYAGIWGSYSDSLYSSGSANSSFSTYSTYNGDALVSGSFAMAVVGTGNATATGYLYAQAYAHAYSPSEPVPEPESYALILAGLALVSWMARRRES